MDTFDFEGHRVSYLRAGQGEPMVFLHNAGTSHRIWTNQIEHFAATHEVLALDLLGFGDSAKPELDYTLELWVRMLSAFLEHLDLTEVTLVGNCVGSATALRYAATQPGRVARVVALNILTPETNSGVLDPFVTLARRVPAAARLLAHLTLPAVVARAILRATHITNTEFVDPSVMTSLSRLYGDPSQARVLMSLAANMDSFAAPDPVADVDVPVLTIWGERNRILPVRSTRRLGAASQPAITIAAGHLAMLEQPEAVNTAIESFLQGLPVTGQSGRALAEST